MGTALLSGDSSIHFTPVCSAVPARCALWTTTPHPRIRFGHLERDCLAALLAQVIALSLNHFRDGRMGKIIKHIHPLTAVCDKVSIAQFRKLLGNIRLALLEAVFEVTDTGLSLLTQDGKDLQPDGMAQCLI